MKLTPQELVNSGLGHLAIEVLDDPEYGMSLVITPEQAQEIRSRLWIQEKFEFGLVDG